MALIYVLSAQPELPAPEQIWLDVLFEKSAHAIEFAVLAALSLRAMAAGRPPTWRAFSITVILAWLYALSDELHQSFVPGRSADWSDILVDWLGAAAGAGLWWRWWAIRRGKQAQVSNSG